MYDPYYPDPEEERRQQLAAMDSFANRVPMSQAMEQYGPPPEPDVERAAAVLEAPERSGPTPRELEDDAIRSVRDSYGKKRGFFEDAAPAAIAMGLDALLNKGRGAGAIVGGYGQGVMRRDQEDKGAMREMANLEIMRAREGANDDYRKQQNALGVRNADLREGELAEMRARRLKEGAGLNEAQKSQAALDDARAWEIYSKDPTALTPAQQAANDDRDAARQDRKDQAKERGADRDEARKMRITQADATEFAKYRAAREGAEKNDRLATETFNEKTKATRDLARTVQGMEGIMSKYPEGQGDNLPGVGNVESGWLGQWERKWGPDAVHDKDTRTDAIRMDEARRQANQTYKVIKTGLAAPIAEAEDIAMANGFAEGASEKQFREGMKVLSDVTKRELRSRASASPANARRALQAEGMDEWVGGWGPDSVAQPYPEYKSPYADALQGLSAPPTRDLESPGPSELQPANELGNTGTRKLRELPTIDTNDRQEDPYMRRYRPGGFDLRKVAR